MQTQTPSNELRPFLAMLRRRWLIVFGTGVLIAALAFAAASMRGLTYQSNAEVLIEQRRPSAPDAALPVDPRVVSNELAILNGQKIIGQAVEATDSGVVPLAFGSEDRDVVTLTAKSTDPEEAELAVTTQLDTYITERGADFGQAIENIDQRLAEIEATISVQAAEEDLVELLRTEQLELLGSKADLTPLVTSGGITVLTSASIPTKSSDLSATAIAIAGLLVGLVLGAGLAGLVEHLDPRVRRSTDLRTITGAKIVVTVGERLGKSVVLTERPESAQADIYRSLTTALAHSGVGDSISSLHIAAVDDPRAGSVVAANLAIGFSRAGVETLLTDVDPWDPCLHAQLGLDNEFGVANVAQGSCSIAEVTQWLDGEPALSVVTIGDRFAQPGELVMHPAWRRTISEVVDLSTLSILDAGVVGGRPAIAAILADASIVVTTTSTTKDELESAMTALNTIGARVIACVEAGSTGTRAGRRHRDRGSEANNEPASTGWGVDEEQTLYNDSFARTDGSEPSASHLLPDQDEEPKDAGKSMSERLGLTHGSPTKVGKSGADAS